MNKKPKIIPVLAGISFLFFLILGGLIWQFGMDQRRVPDWERAYKDVIFQVNLGPRYPGSEGHARLQEWLVAELVKAGWETEKQTGLMLNQPVVNIIAKRGGGKPWTILGAHYDTRMVADNDPEPANRSRPVPGANDGASGVAVLLELARTLPPDLDKEVWLVFFDAEDQGRLPGWDWILGSRYFVNQLKGKPDEVIVIDMIGDKDLNIYIEQTSNPELSQKLWETARKTGYAEQFIPTIRHAILDDHTPFLQKGISAVDLIDFDYPYWHTINDTADKVSAGSLRAVGETLRRWLIK